MIRLLLRRITFGVLVLWIVATAVFVMYFVAPNNVARSLAGRNASAETVALIQKRLELDLPLTAQYGHYLLRLAHGDLGESFLNWEPVINTIKLDLPVTASLAIGGAVLWMLMGVGAGVISATRPRSIVDRAVTSVALLFYSIPNFLLGEIFLFFLFFRLSMARLWHFPPSGYVPLSEDPWQWAMHLFLPWMSIALVSAATYARLTRGALLDVLGEDYVRTARAKGITERRVTWRHGMRSAVGPVTTQFGIDFGSLLGGAVVTEKVFGLHGLGAEAVDSVMRQDLHVIMGITLVGTAAVVVANIVVDMLYAVIDPRVRPA